MADADYLRRCAPNLDVQFTDLPRDARASAAAAAGFPAVECRWPFDSPVPSPDDVDAFVDGIERAGIPLIGMNLWGGDLPRGDRGMLSDPDAESWVRESLTISIRLQQRLGIPQFVALYGRRRSDMPSDVQDEHAQKMMTYVAGELADHDSTMLLEPVSGIPDYPLLTAASVVDVLHALDAPNARLLADLFHIQAVGDDPALTLQTFASVVGHVQFADEPGRGAPGTGTMNIPAVLHALDSIGYAGWIGLEYAATSAELRDAASVFSPSRGVA